jgi:hypothetical protein
VWCIERSCPYSSVNVCISLSSGFGAAISELGLRNLFRRERETISQVTCLTINPIVQIQIQEGKTEALSSKETAEAMVNSC